MRKLVTFLLGLLCVFTTVLGQRRPVKGKVVDENNVPVPSASIQIKGTSSGVAADTLGNFTINAAANDVLIISALNFGQKEVAVGNKLNLNVSLARNNASTIDEVVVTALGVSREKRALAYSVQTVSPDALRSAQEPNVVNALAGKVAGIQINNSGGQAGTSSRIVIRGNSSLTGNNQPLFVIDGIPVDNSVDRAISENDESALFNGYGGNRAIDIDPNTIESTTVLKGAAATALYGSRGAFGVILITTKKGRASAGRKIPRINVSSSVSFDNAYTDGYQDKYLQGLNRLYKNGLPLGAGGYSEDPGAASQTSGSWGPHRDSVSQAVIDSIGMPQVIDPRKELYRTGKVYSNSVTVSGGNDKSTYALTYSNLTQDGIVPNNTFKRNSVKASFTNKLTDYFTSTTSVTYINTKNNRLTEGNGARAFTYGLNFQPISFDAKRAYEERGNSAWTAAGSGFNNPFWLVENNVNPSAVDRLIASNEINIQLASWLKLTNRIGIDTYTDEQAEHVNIGTLGYPGGRMYNGLIKRRQVNNDLILSAQGNIGSDWKVSGLIGHNINSRNFARRTVRGTTLSLPGFYDITNAQATEALQADSKRRLIGVYASATLEYKNFLYLNAAARNDWSSTLPVGGNSFFYPSVSAGLVFTELLDIDKTIFPYGKIRLSYAQAGNDAAEYLTNQTYARANPSDGTRGNITFPFNGINGFLTNGILANGALKPEKVTEKEIGGEFKFFKSRLGLDIAYYDKVSKNQILQQEVAGSSGYSERVINAGELSNKGIEISLTATPIKTRDFTWDLQLNFAKNKYKLKSIAENVDNIFLGGFSDPQIRADKDYGYGVIWGLGFKKTEDGKQLLIDDDGYPIAADDLGPIGNATPDWTAGLRTTFSYKGLSLSMLFDKRQGGDILNMDSYYSVFYGTAKVTQDRYTNTVWEGIRESDGKANTTPIFRDDNYWRTWYSSSFGLFVEDGSFFKLREITLSYALPQSWLAKTPFEGISVYATGRNLWIKSSFTYKDPEGNLLGNTNAQGFYHAVVPGTRGITAGLNVNF